MEKILGNLFFGGLVTLMVISVLGSTVFNKQWKNNVSIEPVGFFYCGLVAYSFVMFALIFASKALGMLSDLFK